MSKDGNGSDAPKRGLDRRGAMGVAATACLAMMSQRGDAATGASGAPAGSVPSGGSLRYSKDTEAEGMREYRGIHEGKGAGNVKFFGFDGAPAPANFLIYDLPPGASEGVHTHFLDNRNQQGSFDEYYYIVSGQGQMEINGEIVQVSQGDHVHTPLEVAHGIENTHPTQKLKVFLTFIKRGNEPRRMPARTSSGS